MFNGKKVLKMILNIKENIFYILLNKNEKKYEVMII